MNTDFRLPVRIYYEDTDAGGVAYYAGYLRFLERARTEWLRALGFSQDDLMRERGIAFAVRSLAVEYLKPARLDDLVEVTTGIESLGRAQVTFRQRVELAGEILVDATVRVACLDIAQGRAAAIPKPIHDKMKALA
ncbi:MAG: tol-pal system-associated acyl-CoA thioesterase [Candidatus Nitricoxidivorans perseverans]|uniref:Tol-pal system-associated acyl-CoA thioesterase n=1 Tax=Candidatus Nitricoxidivorans perseverans TaxID=2975601 RepID=A0AA49IVP2_9PROT|nr:MAG: tol-pal system-associated acyl-CoA thioesterase [Candidatus Nitricoxidivorans perseverans]